jgi:hypothetical protein
MTQTMQEITKLQHCEAQLESAKQKVAFRDAIIKLMDNREFRKVVREGFMVTAAADYARESGNPAINERQRADALALAQAPGHFKRWLNAQLMMGDNAQSEIVEIEEVMEAIRSGTYDEEAE